MFGVISGLPFGTEPKSAQQADRVGLVGLERKRGEDPEKLF
jgi:hypothetical protein